MYRRGVNIRKGLARKKQMMNGLIVCLKGYWPSETPPLALHPKSHHDIEPFVCDNRLDLPKSPLSKNNINISPTHLTIDKYYSISIYSLTPFYCNETTTNIVLIVKSTHQNFERSILVWTIHGTQYRFNNEFWLGLFCSCKSTKWNYYK